MGTPGMEKSGRKCTSHCTPALGAEGEHEEVPAGILALVGLPLAVAAGVEVEGNVRPLCLFMFSALS